MGVVLNLSQKLNIDASATSAEVVASKVDEHYVFGIFLLVDKKSLGKFLSWSRASFPVRLNVPAIGSM